MAGNPLLDKGIIKISDQEPEEEDPVHVGHVFAVPGQFEYQNQR